MNPSNRITIRISDTLKANLSHASDNEVRHHFNMHHQGEDSSTFQILDMSLMRNLEPNLSEKSQKFLHVLLGERYDSQWTSSTEPRKSRGGEKTPSSVKQTEDPYLSIEVLNLDLTLTDKTGVSYALPSHLIQMLQSWFVKYAACEMGYIWEDLGPFFWPRWIRRGVCLNTERFTCSWPPGMKCRASGSREVFILQWKCETDSPNLRMKRESQERKRHRRYRLRPGRELTKEKRLFHELAHSFNISRRFSSQSPFQIHFFHSSLEQNASPVKEDEEQIPHRKRLEKRIIRQLSITRSDRHCEWNVQKYLVTDKCSCSCA